MKKTNPSEPKTKNKRSPKSTHMDHMTMLFLTTPKNLGNFFVPKHPCSFSIIPSTKKIQSSKQHITLPISKQNQNKKRPKEGKRKNHIHKTNLHIHIHKTNLHSSPTFNRKRLDSQGPNPFFSLRHYVTNAKSFLSASSSSSSSQKQHQMLLQFVSYVCNCDGGERGRQKQGGRKKQKTHPHTRPQQRSYKTERAKLMRTHKEATKQEGLNRRAHTKKPQNKD